jgi:hypothetical protein
VFVGCQVESHELEGQGRVCIYEVWTQGHLEWMGTMKNQGPWVEMGEDPMVCKGAGEGLCASMVHRRV